MQTRCVNVDWLELYVLENPDTWPMNADFFRRNGFVVQEREYGTRIYAEMFKILDDTNESFIEVRRNPIANKNVNDKAFLEPYAAHIRLSNKWCYAKQPVTIMQEFLLKYGYTLKSIYRIDICLDFELFDYGDKPEMFMQRFMSGKYTKINQSRVSAHGEDMWEGRKWNSISWGKPDSMISTKFYNKTLELTQVKDKPYIRYAWHDAKLIEDPITMQRKDKDGNVYKPNIWRVEFSIKSSAAKWYVVEDCNGKKHKRIFYPHTLDLYDSKDKLLFVFASLSHFYFHFKHFIKDQRKDRCPDKMLFKFDSFDTVYRPVRLAAEKSDNRGRILRLINQLTELQQYYAEEQVRRSIKHIINYLQDRIILHDLNNPDEVQAIRIVREIFMKSPETITEEEIYKLDKKIAKQIEIQFK